MIRLLSVVQQQLLGLHLADVLRLRVVRLDEQVHEGRVFWDASWLVWLPCHELEVVLWNVVHCGKYAFPSHVLHRIFA